MPIYEYTCEKCQSHFELLVRGEERPACPRCASDQLQKEWSVPAAHVGGALPIVSQSPRGGCGKPQCGMGGCGHG